MLQFAIHVTKSLTNGMKAAENMDSQMSDPPAPKRTTTVKYQVNEFDPSPPSNDNAAITVTCSMTCMLTLLTRL